MRISLAVLRNRHNMYPPFFLCLSSLTACQIETDVSSIESSIRLLTEDSWLVLWNRRDKMKQGNVLTVPIFLLKSKCHQYWTDTECTYGAITVSLNRTESFADFVIRTFILKNFNSFTSFATSCNFKSMLKSCLCKIWLFKLQKYL